MAGMSGSKDNIDPYDARKNRRHLRKKSLSESASIQMMRDVNTSSAALNNEQSSHSKPQDDLHLVPGRLSSGRKKTSSSSTEIQCMRQETIQESIFAEELGENVSVASQKDASWRSFHPITVSN
jgi:hypothetical protein